MPSETCYHQISTDGHPEQRVETLVDYYRRNRFNPVPIALTDSRAWESHFAKRLNLYQRHLGVPLALLRDRAVLEFGCNSAENALVLAAVGANLTLVEPNEQAFPRLRAQFKERALDARLVALVQAGVEDFTSEARYDLILTEGFLYTLPNRDEMVRKIAELLAPGGLAVISFNDRYSCLLEMTRRLILWRVCQLEGVEDASSAASLEIAGRLYREDFAQLNASRPFEAWWKDTLANPFLRSKRHWSYPELIAVIEEAGCEFHAASPQWTTIDHFSWYKNAPDRFDRHRRLLADWRSVFPFFITGFQPLQPVHAADEQVVHAVSTLVADAADYTTDTACAVAYPDALDAYLRKQSDARLSCFNAELKELYAAIQSNSASTVTAAYHRASLVRKRWGAPYHYICFTKCYRVAD